ncbi:MAG: hypothetical protein J0H14_03095 [Alphaproteobacteria bacterium]|nr:hypothetical protein [Alphaproteobacteria bacterium]
MHPTDATDGEEELSRRGAMLRAYLAGDRVVMVGPPGYRRELADLGVNAAVVECDAETRQVPSLGLPPGSQDAVFANDVLACIGDYRAAIAEWFGTLKVGGRLVIAVPHQFLFERKLFPPSRWETQHRRFYTTSLLLTEIEEALDPLSYRVRDLTEDDEDFDYSAPPDQSPTGSCDIIVVLERMARPPYADALLDERSGDRATGRFVRVPGPAASEPVVAIETTAGPPQRILVLKLDHRGDFIMGRPAMELLRREFPSSHLTLVCGPWNRADAEQLGLFNEVIGFAFFPEVASHVSDLAKEEERVILFARHMAGRSYDLAIDLRVDQDTRLLLTAVDATQRAGFGTAERFPFLDIALPFINPTVSGRAEQRLIMPDRFTAMAGRHEGFAIVNPDDLPGKTHGDRLIYGPYADFEAGDWTLEIIIEPLASDFDLTYDVCWDVGSNVIGAGILPVRRGVRPRIALHLEEALKGVEIRVSVGPSNRVRPYRFLGCRVGKRGAFPALHQQEMLVLLASLVAHRMRFPYQTVDTATRLPVS